MEISEITHNKENKQLYLEAEGKRALIDYQLKNDKMYLTYSEVPIELRGKGIGKTLVEQSLEKLIEEGYDKKYSIIAKCSYIQYIVRKSEKWSQIIA